MLAPPPVGVVSLSCGAVVVVASVSLILLDDASLQCTTSNATTGIRHTVSL